MRCRTIYWCSVAPTWRRIGPLDEHYRFYRILDLDLSYAIRGRVGRLLPRRTAIVRHRHALWEALSEGDREERSRKNFGRFLKRWDHRHDLTRHGRVRRTGRRGGRPRLNTRCPSLSRLPVGLAARADARH